MLSPADEPSGDDGAGPAATLRVACAATALVLVAFTMPLGLLTEIAADLPSGPAGRTWVIGAMSVGLAGMLLVAGSLADALGRRRVFVWGIGIFGASSLLAAAAPAAGVVALARFGNGVGGAAMLAGALSLIAQAFPDPTGEARTHATGLWGAMLGVGIAVGPTGGALIAGVGGWRTAYVVLALLSLALVPLALRGVVESRGATPPGRVDLPGALLLGLGMAALTAGVVQGGPLGFTAPVVLALLAAGLLLLAAFAVLERRLEAPLLDVSLLGRPAFLGATLGSFVLGVAVLAFMSYVSLVLRDPLGASVLAAAAWTLPWSVVSFVVAVRARSLARVLSARVQTTLGLLLCTAGLLLAGGLRPGDDGSALLPGLLVLGVGTGLMNAALARAAVGTVPPERSGMGAGANNTARYFGAAIGVALVAVVLQGETERRAAEELRAVPAAAGTAARTAAAISADDPPPPASAGVPARTVAAVDERATVGAVGHLLLLAAGTTGFGAVLCWLLMASGPPAAGRPGPAPPGRGEAAPSR